MKLKMKLGQKDLGKFDIAPDDGLKVLPRLLSNAP